MIEDEIETRFFPHGDPSVCVTVATNHIFRDDKRGPVGGDKGRGRQKGRARMCTGLAQVVVRDTYGRHTAA